MRGGWVGLGECVGVSWVNAWGVGWVNAWGVGWVG